jgi:hypothetical protein
MLPLFQAPFDANTSVLLASRLGPAEPVDPHPPPAPSTTEAGGSDPLAGGGPALAGWTAFARSLGLARETVFDIVRAAGLDAGHAREVADAVAEAGKGAKAEPAQPAAQGARLALVFKGVSVSFAAGDGSASVNVAEVSIKASLGTGSGDGQLGFGQARLSLAVSGETVSVAAGNDTLQARVQELGVSVDAAVTLDEPPAPGAASEPAPANVTGLGFDLAVPLQGTSPAGQGGPAPVNVTV